MALSRGLFSLLVLALTVLTGCSTKFTIATDTASDGDDSGVVVLPDASAGADVDPGGDGGMSPSDCVPTVKCGEMVECGSVSDGCDNLLQCGVCAAGSRCQLGHCVPQVFCGNGVCEEGEDCGSCAQDCKCAAGGCSAGKCCARACTGKLCGDDGCGGICGDCAGGFQCVAGACIPMPSCGNGTCELALMENCATCAHDCGCNAPSEPPGMRVCRNGACCQPACAGRTCGSDGCGGTCAPGCGAGSTCDVATGKCVEQIVCGDPLNPQLPGKCQSGENCITCPLDCGCKVAGERCSAAGTCCIPKCTGLACGPDGCGGQCGPGMGEGGCPLRQSCQSGKCVGCGNGICEPGETCANCADCKCDVASGQVCANETCCARQCAGKTCGPDGCGGQCGSCSMGQACDPSGVCVTLSTCGDGKCALGEDCQSCPKDCGCAAPSVCSGAACCMPTCLGVCGSDGCGGSCGTCPAGTTCGRGGACAAVCGDGVCAAAAGENCGTCPSDCLCARGASCFNNACCRVPVCGIDWECGGGTVCGVAVVCNKCPLGTSCLNHSCGTLCTTGVQACPVPL